MNLSANMSKAEKILNNIVRWAQNEENIRGVIMVGSRALDQSDELSDFDISIFANNIDDYIQDNSWISKVTNIWVFSLDQYNWNEVNVPTRLVIYDSGVKVDYSLWNAGIVEKLGQSDFFDTGFKVLVDKDGILAKFKPASLKPKTPKKPTQDEFLHTINEFWFEAYHVAKYLKREDLWLVKFRDWSLQVYLLKMMEWYMLAKNNWDYDVKWTGKQIKKWLDPDIYKRLDEIFSHFDKEDGWKALQARLNLFRDLSKETAKNLAYSYPQDVDENLTKFILSLKEGKVGI